MPTVWFTIFFSFKNNAEKAHVSLFPNARQMTIIARNLIKRTIRESPEQQAAMIEVAKSKNVSVDSFINEQLKELSTPETQSQIPEKFAQAFRKVIVSGEKNGVVWKDAKFISYDIDTINTTVDYTQKEVSLVAEIKSINGVVNFQSGKVDYRMNFKNIFFISEEQGWFGGEFKEVIKKGEIFLQEGETRIGRTSKDTAFVITTTAVPQAKTKTNSGNTKTKTKSSAQKPAIKS